MYIYIYIFTLTNLYVYSDTKYSYHILYNDIVLGYGSTYQHARSEINRKTITGWVFLCVFSIHMFEAKEFVQIVSNLSKNLWQPWHHL